MFAVDQLAAKIAPGKLDAERDAIQSKLGILTAEREELRVAAGRLFHTTGAGLDAISRERQIDQHHARIGEIDAAVRELRARRRQIAELLRPPSAVKAALVNIPITSELATAIDDLNAARRARQRLIAEPIEDRSEAAEKKRAGKIAEIENHIRDLRVRRAELLAPYNAAVSQALAPLIRAAATRLDDAAAAFIAAVDELREIAAVAPPAGVGLGNGLERIAGINTHPARAARALTATILHAANPEAEIRAWGDAG